METINIKEGINLNLIETDKFKSRLLVFNIIRPLKREDATKNALLTLVLRRGTEKYSNNLEIQRKMEELYGVRLNLNVIVRGNKHIIRLTLQFVDERYINDENYFSEVIDLVTEIIFNPKLENGIFNEEYLEQEKKNLIRRIESKINDKRNYAIERTIEEMFNGESFAISRIGYIEDMEDISSEILFDYYKRILKDSPMEIFYTGKMKEKTIDYLKSSIKTDRENIISLKREKVTGLVDQIKTVEEKLDVNQGKIVLAYRTGIPYEDDLYTALVLAVQIFGGTPNSKLFLNVREKESLAYYIAARIFKFKSFITVDAGIEFDKYEDTLKIIEEELNKMKTGDFTERDIEIAKKSLISSLESVEDSLHNILEYNFNSKLTDDYRDVNSKIENVQKVTKDEIIQASKKIILDTMYFMNGSNVKEGEKDNEDI